MQNGEEGDGVLKELQRIIEKQNGHADFFKGAGRDYKKIEEQSVAEIVVMHLGHNDYEFRNPPKDPPDCAVRLQDGRLIGIEVTELVDEKTRALHASSKKSSIPLQVGQIWDLQTVKLRLAERLEQKDVPPDRQSGGPYDLYFVVVYTDEMISDLTALQCALRSSFKNRLNHITDAYLVPSYDPSLKQCPVIELT